MEMLPGSGPFDVALPFNSNAQGSLDLEALQIEWVEGMANQVFRPAPIISGHMVVWDEIAAEVAKEFPDGTWDKMLGDAMTVRMTLN